MKVAMKELPLVDEITRKSGQQVNLCFHCQKCASGCPISEFAKHSPNQILRLIQMGLHRQALQSSVIWLCSGCETCGTRCPNGIKISEVFDVLKELSIKEGISYDKNIQTFNETFLKSVEFHDRVQEFSMMAEYRLKSPKIGNLLLDLGVGWKMLSKGKFSFTPGSKNLNNSAQKIFLKIKEYVKREGY